MEEANAKFNVLLECKVTCGPPVSVVSIATSYWPWQLKVNILFSKGDHLICGANLASCLVDAVFIKDRTARV
jgi:hypothetical protein